MRASNVSGPLLTDSFDASITPIRPDASSLVMSQGGVIPIGIMYSVRPTMVVS